ncbi:endonuclease domain-containing protein [Pontixanthobacter sp.]|uniref:endonuclease domain-containing protein n=1 Tax=Pontixanthobacter sp. TaxID=2792078 RepID=UPI003C7AD135
MPRPKTPRNVTAARKLRANMSLPELLLWRELRAQTRVKFRRQHPIGEYVLDFYCASARLCVEIDGIAHDMGDRPERDQLRDTWLTAQNIEVIRIPARDVLRSPANIAEALVRHCEQ